VVGKKLVSRAEFARLKADHERVMAELSAMRDQLRQHANDLRVQFTRIAEMQAILDEEFRTNNAAARPLIRRGRAADET